MSPRHPVQSLYLCALYVVINKIATAITLIHAEGNLEEWDTYEVYEEELQSVANYLTSLPHNISEELLQSILSTEELDVAIRFWTLMGKKDIIDLTTSGSVTIKKPENLKFTVGNHSILVSSIFIGSVPKEEVATWIIALAIIAGILIFMFLVIGLMKAGFFERKKKEELKALKAVDAIDEFTIGTFQTDDADIQELENEDYDHDETSENKTSQHQEWEDGVIN